MGLDDAASDAGMYVQARRTTLIATLRKTAAAGPADALAPLLAEARLFGMDGSIRAAETVLASRRNAAAQALLAAATSGSQAAFETALKGARELGVPGGAIERGSEAFAGQQNRAQHRLSEAALHGDTAVIFKEAAAALRLGLGADVAAARDLFHRRFVVSPCRSCTPCLKGIGCGFRLVRFFLSFFIVLGWGMLVSGPQRRLACAGAWTARLACWSAPACAARQFCKRPRSRSSVPTPSTVTGLAKQMR